MFLNALEKRDFVNELSKYTDFHGLKLTNLNEFTELKNCYPEKYKKLVIFLDHFLGRNRIDEDVTLYTDSENETSNAEGYNYYTFNCNFLDGLIQSNSDLEYLIMKLNSIKNKFLYMDSSEFCIINDNKNIPTLCLKKRKSYGTKPPVININNDIDKDYDWVSYVYDKTTLESGFPCRCKYKTYVNYKLDMVVTFKLDDNGQLFNLVSIGSSKAFVYDFLLNPKSFSLGVNMCLHSHNINSYYNSLVVDIMASVEKIVTNSAKTKFNFSFEDILKCELLKSQMYR